MLINMLHQYMHVFKHCSETPVILKNLTIWSKMYVKCLRKGEKTQLDWCIFLAFID